MDTTEYFDCPTCGDSFDTENGMKVHHSKIHGESISGIRITCDYCGGDTRVERWRAERDGETFCGVDCFARWQSERDQEVNKIEVECWACGESLERWPYEVEQSENHFCGNKCYTVWKENGADYEYLKNSIEVKCGGCGETFKKQRAKYEVTDNHYCSTGCFGRAHTGEDNWNWKGGWRVYGTGWNDEKKERVRDRDSRKCVDCGMSESEHYDKFDETLHVHHIKPAREFDDDKKRNAMDNLVTLCRSCHLGKWEN